MTTNNDLAEAEDRRAPMTVDERVDLEDALLDIERALNDIVREVETAQAALALLTGFARRLAEGAADTDADMTT